MNHGFLRSPNGGTVRFPMEADPRSVAALARGGAFRNGGGYLRRTAFFGLSYRRKPVNGSYS